MSLEDMKALRNRPIELNAREVARLLLPELQKGLPGTCVLNTHNGYRTLLYNSYIYLSSTSLILSNKLFKILSLNKNQTLNQ